MALSKFFAIGVISTGIIHHAQATSTDGCTFSISASGGISCPAGQLSDGQIRLNGSYPTAEFTIRGDKIWDSAGRGCIVTEAPTTQIQCDLNKDPAPGFSIGSSNTLLYQGSSQFYACPATETEYNVYVKPDFGQSKCFPVTLTASGCGAATSSCSAPGLPSTITETTTCTITQAITLPGSASTITLPGSASTITLPGSASIITVPGSASTTTETTTCTVTDLSTLISLQTVTSTLPCTTSSSSTTSKICQKCQAKSSTSSTTTTTSSSCTTGAGNYTTTANSTWTAPYPTATTSSQLY